MALPLPPADWLKADCVLEGESSRTPGVGDLLGVVLTDVELALVEEEQELPPDPVQEPEEFGDAAGVAGEFGDAAGGAGVWVAAEGDEVPDGATRAVPPVVCAKALGPVSAIATAAAR